MNQKDLNKLCIKVFGTKFQNEQFLNQIILKCKKILRKEGINESKFSIENVDEIEINFKIKQILELIGYCYYLLKDFDKALIIYQTLVISDESPFCVWEISNSKNDVSSYYKDLRKSKVKIFKLTDMLKNKPAKKTYVYKELASEYFFLGYYKLSAEFHKKYLKQKPENFEHWSILGELYEYEKKYKQSIRCFENAKKYAIIKGYLNYAEDYNSKIKELKIISKQN